VRKIEGIFSGTLSYIFNTFGEGQNFSDVVIQAKKLGYTEPDPRDDLSGTDVARKAGGLLTSSTPPTLHLLLLLLCILRAFVCAFTLKVRQLRSLIWVGVVVVSDPYGGW